MLGKIIKRIGTITLWVELLRFDMGPGEITDERIQESAIISFFKACKEITNLKSYETH